MTDRASAFVQQYLKDGVWHSTSLDRYESIRKSGWLKAHPELPDELRWKTKFGADNYPFVRHIGGISVFDFKDFDAAQYENQRPMSSWREFVPGREAWPEAVWIRIDIQQLTIPYIPPDELLTRWKNEDAYRHALMPDIEGAILGDVKASLFEHLLGVNTLTGETFSVAK